MITSLRVSHREEAKRQSRDVVRIIFHEQKHPKRDGTPVYLLHHWDLSPARATELAAAILLAVKEPGE